ncbi:MAG: ROK family protein [Deltaproteobacteria bacterium]|nr:ROK family protein [Deltaproteobacteria bacterium]
MSALGLDLGGTSVRAAVLDPVSGAILASAKEQHADRSPEAVVAACVRVAQAAVAAAGCALPGSAAIGVAGQCAGHSGLVVNAPNLGWRMVPLAERLGRALGLRVRVLNDLSAAAIGEHRFGAARGVEDAVLFFAGSGVGAGLLVGGRLAEGGAGFAGEVGHVKVIPRPTTPERRCGCGQLGCLEAYTGGHALTARAREALAAGRMQGLAAAVGGDAALVIPSRIEQAAAAGDADAASLWEEAGELLGDAAANLVTVLNPARLVLGGGVLLGCPLLFARVEARLRDRASASAGQSLAVVRAALGDDAGVVGAALAGAGG